AAAKSNASNSRYLSFSLCYILYNSLMAFVAAMITAIASVVSVLLLRAVWVTLSCYFLTPMRIRRTMAAQGVHGPPPRPLVGNLRQVSALVAEANAGDMTSLS
uniref:Uncharacterized protein n=1 Tax=Aegilops tauschii subsp. strangulata TaxID=200361 RepID=A0A453KSQ8_AEGTS